MFARFHKKLTSVNWRHIYTLVGSADNLPTSVHAGCAGIMGLLER